MYFRWDFNFANKKKSNLNWFFKNTYLLSEIARVKCNHSAYIIVHRSFMLHSKKLVPSVTEVTVILPLSVHS